MAASAPVAHSSRDDAACDAALLHGYGERGKPAGVAYDIRAPTLPVIAVLARSTRRDDDCDPRATQPQRGRHQVCGGDPTRRHALWLPGSGRAGGPVYLPGALPRRPPAHTSSLDRTRAGACRGCGAVRDQDRAPLWRGETRLQTGRATPDRRPHGVDCLLRTRGCASPVPAPAAPGHGPRGGAPFLLRVGLHGGGRGPRAPLPGAGVLAPLLSLWVALVAAHHRRWAREYADPRRSPAARPSGQSA